MSVSISSYVMEHRIYLNTEVAPINIITQEQISRILRISADFEKLHQVIVLTVDVSAYSDRSIHFQQIWFGPQNLRGLRNDVKRLLFSQPAFAIEMLLKESKIRLRGFIRVVELLVGWFVEGWSLNICNRNQPTPLAQATMALREGGVSWCNSWNYLCRLVREWTLGSHLPWCGV